MGIGPVPAIQKALALAGLKLDQLDLVEVNEAFAAQYLSVEKALGLDRDITNVNGGYGAASACIGGGQGIAMILESTS